MDDVAVRTGVSKGALYTYIESKEALFDLCVRFADSAESIDDQIDLPVKTPAPGTTTAYVERRLANHPGMARIAELLSSDTTTDARAELETVVRILYRTLLENRRAIKLVDVAAVDHPELSSTWFKDARGGLNQMIVPYILERVRRGEFLPLVDVDVAARHLIETCVLWAVHRHWDPSPQVFDEERVEDAVVQNIVRVFLGEMNQ